MSSQERLRLERDMTRYPYDLLVGAATNNLSCLEPGQPATLVLDERGKSVRPISAIYGSRNANVANFCAAVYSRDGWSGWHTYREDGKDCGELCEFFAAPHVLRKAIRAMIAGREGSVYRVKPDCFRPYEPIPGQFVAVDDVVPVKDEYRLSIMDMRQPIARTAHLVRADRARPIYTRREPPKLDLTLVLSASGIDASILGDLSSREVATTLMNYRDERTYVY